MLCMFRIGGMSMLPSWHRASATLFQPQTGRSKPLPQRPGCHDCMHPPAIQRMASCTSKGYCMSPSTRPGVSMKVVACRAECKLQRARLGVCSLMCMCMLTIKLQAMEDTMCARTHQEVLVLGCGDLGEQVGNDAIELGEAIEEVKEAHGGVAGQLHMAKVEVRHCLHHMSRWTAMPMFSLKMALAML